MTETGMFTELSSKDIDGNMRQFSEWTNKVVMVANVASA